MIAYFSAEGNSRYVANRLAWLLDDNVSHIFDFKGVIENDILVIVTPVYSWGLPLPVVEWIRNTSFGKPGYCAAVLTCGDDIGNADKLLERELKGHGITLDCCMSIQMPNTYVILPGFNVDSKEVEHDKLAATPERITQIADTICSRCHITDVVRGSFPNFKTSIIYPLFLKMGINTDKFHATENCISCGRCAELCPQLNIKMTADPDKGIPHWGRNCVSCLACYHHCPVHAVQYGSITKHKGQYVCQESGK